MKIGVRRLPHAAGLELPHRGSAESAGLDLRAALSDEITLKPGERRLVPTGLVLEIPPGYEGQIRPRSGLALRYGVTVANAPGTVDSDYRGEVGVVLIHLGDEPVTLARGDRIAQLVVARVEVVELVERDTLEGSTRGDGGFGSTGLA